MSTDAPGAHRSAFESPIYRRYFPSTVFSTLATWLVRFLLGWSGWELTGSAFWVGIVAGCLLVPALLLSPLFGILSDRLHPLRGLQATFTAMTASTTAAVLLHLGGFFTLPALLVLSLVLGVITSAHTPFRLAFIPLLVHRDALPSAIGYSAMIFNTGRILGPALGAWLLSLYSMEVAWFVSLVLFATALSILFTLRGIDRPTGKARASLLEELRDGLSYAGRDRGIRLILGFTLVNSLFGRTILELLPALSGRLLAGDAATLAVLTGLAGVGSIVGGLIMSRQGSGQGALLRIVSLSLCLGCLVILPAHWLRETATLGVAVLALSLVTTTVGTGSQALAQLVVDEHYRGRVLSLWSMLALGGPSLGAMFWGWLADRIGFPGVLPLMAVLTLGAVVVLYRNRRALAVEA